MRIKIQAPAPYLRATDRDAVQACALIDNRISTNAAMKLSSAPITRGEMPTPATETKRRRRRQMLISPQPGSLYDILHDHAGLQLFVRPLCWTDLHAKLLGCRFVRLPPHETPTPSPSSPPWSPPSTPPAVISIIGVLNLLMSSAQPELSKTRAMSTLLSEFYPKTFMYPQDQVDLDLRFGPRRYPHAVRCHLLFNHIYPNTSTTSFDSSTTWTTSQAASYLGASTTLSTSNDPSMLAYVSRSHINHVRRTCYNIMSGPNGTANHPVRRLQALRSKALIPKNLDEDSYFVAVMLAMAQQLVYPDVRNSAEFIPRDVKVHLLTVAEEEDAFIVYTAIVPAALLSMFHEPDAAPTGNAEIKVEYAQVPVWPVLGLKERLGKALGSDIVGAFDATVMDTYDNEAVSALETPSSSGTVTPPNFKPTSSKRKRGVFSEVLNASFSENRESDRPRDLPGKRRRRQEAKVGVVRSLFNLDEHVVKNSLMARRL
ncbi:hypothetical protein F4823DRAFT_604851 [Ustulina deusta]|nr:hypothetical protein F4823DRAFT_604851 [Ustulina deusta]